MAQTGTKHYKIAVFTPIYLDSAFEGSTYKLGNANLPKSILPGLEFYNGIMLAIDSLQAEGAPIEINIYDSKSSTDSITSILLKTEFNDVSLIIASFTNRREIKILTDYAVQKNIQLISATYPNDGGVTSNPGFILLNSGLRTHCEELYKHIQRFYATGNLIMFTRKGALETMIQSIFGEMGRNTPSLPLKIKTVELPDIFTSQQLTSYLDSGKQNIVICGTMNEAFGLKLVRTLSAAHNYPATAIGMPTWDGLKELDRSDCKGIDIVYSTPFYFSRTNKAGLQVVQKYKAKLNARPSDMVFKGYETMFHFTKLLLAYGDSMVYHLSDRNFKLFNDFVIRPVRNKSDSRIIDYMENKKLYFIKKTDGVVRSVN